MHRSFALAAAAVVALATGACHSGAGWADSAAKPAMAREEVSAGLLDAAPMERKVMRSADLRLNVDDLDGTGSEIVRLTHEAGGFVLSSSRTSYHVKVPAQGLDASLERFESLGDVTHRALHGEDVTAEYMDLEVRLKNAHAARDSYAELLKKAASVEEILKVEQALREVQERIERLEGRRKFLGEHLTLSDVRIHLRETRTPGPLQVVWNVVTWPFKKLWWWD
jgi:hypothetical protein